MPIPEERVDLMRRGRNMIPYFSAGLVVFEENGAERFPDIWYDTACRIDRIETLDKKRPYLDQMSLPLAMQRAGQPWNILPEEQHFILGGRLRGQPLPKDRDIFTVHYRKPGILKEVGLHGRARGMLHDKTGVAYVRRLTDQP